MLFSLSVNGNNREVKCYLESDNWIVQNLNNALETWNSKLSEIWQLLTQSPETFKGGDIWSVMLTIHDALKGIGYGLLVLFFAISVVKTCSSYLDVKKPEHPFIGFMDGHISNDYSYMLSLEYAEKSLCGKWI